MYFVWCLCQRVFYLYRYQKSMAGTQETNSWNGETAAAYDAIRETLLANQNISNFRMKSLEWAERSG